MKRYQVAVIGSGPGGYVAAIRAAQLGFQTVCIEKEKTFGGTCLNVGCIPSKALLEATDLLFHLQEKGKTFGIISSSLTADFPKMMERKNEVVKGFTEGIAHLFAKNGVFHLRGKASFIDPHQIEIESKEGKERIEADYIVIATGSEPVGLSFLPFDEETVLSSTGALELKRVPKKMLVIGGGIIGVEIASIYSRLGTKVEVIEMLDRICPMIDETLSRELLQTLKGQGIEFFLGSKVTSSTLAKHEVRLIVEQEGKSREFMADAALVAIGRKPYVEGLNLEKIGIKQTAKRFIEVDAEFKTSHPHIFAIGDVIEGPSLAHKASAEAIAVIDSLKGKREKVNYLAIPNVIYTDPEIATAGLTEKEASFLGIDCFVGKSVMKANSRARCALETIGLVKVVGDKSTGRLLGVHIFSAHASELIGQAVIAIQKHALVSDLAYAPTAHPTLSEAIKEAALDAIGNPIHH